MATIGGDPTRAPRDRRSGGGDRSYKRDQRRSDDNWQDLMGRGNLTTELGSRGEGSWPSRRSYPCIVTDAIYSDGLCFHRRAACAS